MISEDFRDFICRNYQHIIDFRHVNITGSLGYPYLVNINLGMDVCVSGDEVVIAAGEVILRMKDCNVCHIDVACFTDDGLAELKRFKNVRELKI